MTLRTDPELDAALTELSETQGLSKQEVVRRAVLDMHARSLHRRLVADSSRRMIEEWGDVLDRLGKA